MSTERVHVFEFVNIFLSGNKCLNIKNIEFVLYLLNEEILQKYINFFDSQIPLNIANINANVYKGYLH